MFGISFIILVSIIFAVLYAPRAYCWFASLKPQKRLVSTKNNRLALFIPARNEGKSVIPLLESIDEQTYSRDYFDIFIVVKDPADEVYYYGNAVGAEVLCDPAQTCKGDCLNYGFNKIIHKYPGKYDGFIIVDADCVLKPDFMEQMNNAMESGADVINAKKLVGNYYTGGGRNDNLVTACNGLIWTFMDDMGNRWKSDHGFTTMTVTTGIMISARLVEKMDGWTYRQTLTEDMELQRDCSLQGYKTFYYSYAQFYMQEAPTLEETDKRRNRWMNGLTHADFIYAHDMLAKRGFHSFADNYFMFCLWIVYLYVAIMLATAVFNIVGCAYLLFQGDVYAWHMLLVSGYAVGAVYFAFFLLTLAALIVNRKDVRLSFYDRIAVLFTHPLFYMGYISIVVHAIFDRRPMQWDEIARVESNSAEATETN